MPRPLLEIWRELNRDRNRGPSSLLEQMIADTKRELSSSAALQRQMIARLGRSTLSPLEQAIAAAGKARPLSPTQRALADLARRHETDIAARVMGTPRPIAQAPAKQRKRKPGAGRKPSLTPAQETGLRITSCSEIRIHTEFGIRK